MREEKKRAEIERRALKGKTEEQESEEAQEAAKRNILTIAGGGTLASTAFFYKNIQRLFTKITSGGADDGYNRFPEASKGRGKPAPKGRGKPAPKGRGKKEEEPPAKGGFFR